jgi:hypothetical protein
MKQAGKWSVVAVLAVLSALAACAPGPMVDALPSGLGLPAGAPARPATPYQYPAVHDMPPSRSAPTMSAEQQDKLEKELAAVRDQQEANEKNAPGISAEEQDKLEKELAALRDRQEANEKKASPPAKKKPVAAKNAQPTSPKGNP